MEKIYTFSVSDIKTFNEINNIIHSNNDFACNGSILKNFIDSVPELKRGECGYNGDLDLKIALDIYKNQLDIHNNQLTEDIKSMRHYKDRLIYYTVVASIYANNPEIIVYLRQLLHGSNNISFELADDKYVYYSCKYNPNLCVTKYLIEDRLLRLKNYPNRVWIIPKHNIDILNLAAFYNKNPEIGAYIFDLLNFSQIQRITDTARAIEENFDKIDRLKKFISHIYSNPRILTDNRKLNKFLLPYIALPHYKKIKEYVATLNPLFLNKYNQRIIEFFPSDYKYTEFISYVDKAETQIPIDTWVNFNNFSDYDKYKNYDEANEFEMNCNNYPLYRESNESENDTENDIENDTENQTYWADSTIPLTPIFKHNNQIYYGDKQKFHEAMIIFGDLADNMNFSELITLDGTQPKYIMNMYVHSAHTGIFKMNCIEPNDIMGFIRLIDQYPLKKLTIKILEIDIVKFFEKYGIQYDTYMEDVCKRYELRLLYMAIHNQKIILKTNIQDNCFSSYSHKLIQ